MKPKLKKTNGIWRCWTPGSGAPVGLGLTPRDAYWNHQGRTYVAPQPIGPVHPLQPLFTFNVGDAPGWWRNGPTAQGAH